MNMRNIFKSSSTEQTRSFYEGLVSGQNRRGIWGLENRFDPDLISSKPSVLKHFVPVVARYLSPTDKCLDLGCGPGGFLALMAPLCRTIVGADIVPSFLKECQEMIQRKSIANAETVQLEKGKLPFGDGEFDKVVMIDTIHHLEENEKTLREVARVLKPGGLFLIFEPNKLNPLLALMCALDKNEHGLLKLGTFNAYKRLLGESFEIDHEEYNGMLVGPEGKTSVAIANFVSKPRNRIIGWLSPKLFIVARKVC